MPIERHRKKGMSLKEMYGSLHIIVNLLQLPGRYLKLPVCPCNKANFEMAAESFKYTIFTSITRYIQSFYRQNEH